MGMMLRRRGTNENMTTEAVLNRPAEPEKTESVKDKKQAPVKRTRKPKQ